MINLIPKPIFSIYILFKIRDVVGAATICPSLHSTLERLFTLLKKEKQQIDITVLTKFIK